MPDRVDLDAYFSRIGYGGSASTTLETLRALHALHPAAIAFENLDTLMGKAVSLDPKAIEAKLIGAGRGGYCFEHNMLLAHVLTALGFRVSFLAARVMMSAVPATGRRTHMLLKVETEEGPHIADVGFGGRTLTMPLSLDGEVEQRTVHGPFRLRREGGLIDEQTVVNGAWTTLYRFSLEEQPAAEFDMLNWFVSTYPESPFTSRLMAARTLSDRWYGLMNNQLSLHYPGGRTEKRELDTSAAVAAVLENELAIRLPEPRAAVLTALQRLIPT